MQHMHSERAVVWFPKHVFGSDGDASRAPIYVVAVESHTRTMRHKAHYCYYYYYCTLCCLTQYTHMLYMWPMRDSPTATICMLFVSVMVEARIGRMKEVAERLHHGGEMCHSILSVCGCWDVLYSMVWQRSMSFCVEEQIYTHTLEQNNGCEFQRMV